MKIQSEKRIIELFCPNCGKKLSLEECNRGIETWYEGECDCGFEIIAYDKSLYYQEGWIEITFC
jgi:predicted RNA-binding Zn-ribbon protein involved in translation (DUF1610 family)